MPSNPSRAFLAPFRAELRAAANAKHRQGVLNYFKEPVHPLGVPLPRVQLIARSLYAASKSFSIDDVLSLAEQLVSTRIHEEGLLGLFWVQKRGHQLDVRHFRVLERWFKKFVHNWAWDDTLCGNILGPLLCRKPGLLPRVYAWRASKNRWVRRASAVALVVPVRRGLYLKQALQTAHALAQDEDDMVRKGVGWLLKDASIRYPEDVKRFLRRHPRLPRLVVRLACERLSPRERAEFFPRTKSGP